MKIAIITGTLNICGGTERQVLRLAIELQKLNQTVTIYAGDYDPIRCYPELSTSVKIVSLTKLVKHSKSVGFCAKYFNAAKEVFVRSKKTNALAKLIDSDTEILCPLDQWAAIVAARARPRVPGSKVVWLCNDVAIHGWSLFNDPLFAMPKPNILKRVINNMRDEFEYQRFFRKIDKIVAISERARTVVREAVGRDSSVVNLGVDVETIPFFLRNKPKTPIQLLCNGAFFPHRRYEDVIRALPILRSLGIDARLSIIGDYKGRGVYRAYYEKISKLVLEAKLSDSVRFVGEVSNQNKLLEEYANADIFISANHLQTWGIAPFEAMSAGVPTIISKSAGAAEVVKDNKDGILFAPGDHEGIVRAVTELFSDHNLYKAVSIAGRSLAESLTWKRHALGMLKEFQDVRN